MGNQYFFMTILLLRLIFLERGLPHFFSFWREGGIFHILERGSPNRKTPERSNESLVLNLNKTVMRIMKRCLNVKISLISLVFRNFATWLQLLWHSPRDHFTSDFHDLKTASKFIGIDLEFRIFVCFTKTILPDMQGTELFK